MKPNHHSMPTLSLPLLGAALLLCGQLLQAQKAPDPIGENLFPPELLKEHHQALGLTEDQTSSLRAEVQKAQDRMAELKQQLETEMDALGALVKKERLDEVAIMTQSEKVLNLERDLKQTQLIMLVRIKNALTAEQQAKLKEIKGKMAGWQAKMGKVKALAERWQQEGRDASVLEKLKTELQPLLEQKKYKEAEAVLDRALETLGSGKRPR